VDRALIGRFNGGDSAAFVEIVERYRGRIQSVVGRFLRDEGDAEEITQDTFIRAHRGLARFRGDASLATWLQGIALNLARNRYWYFFRRRRHMTSSLDGALCPDSNATLADVVASTDANPAQQATRDEFIALIAVCMEKLDLGHRELLNMRNTLNHSHEQIARSLGINAGTVKSRIARARGKLRGLLSDACPEFPTDARLNDWMESPRDATQAA
jgi:RNA polymerase sigma-70 factor, ECF subfamily